MNFDGYDPDQENDLQSALDEELEESNYNALWGS